MSSKPVIGFIGLGVMGEPICRNIAAKSGSPVIAFDLSREPLERLASAHVEAAPDIAALVSRADIVMLSLPGGPEVEAVISGPHGIAANARAGQIVVDLSTAPVELTRRLAADLEKKGIRFADAPVARTRQAAIDGTLSIMVGSDADLYAEIEPVLACAASEITHCGPVGCGQAVKILNNMVLMQTVVALAEALAIGAKAGVDGQVLFETLSKGSADSFALRNHGMKAMLPDEFPEGAFPTDYAIKDASYALALAQQTGITARGGQLAHDILEQTSKAGFGNQYWPVLVRTIKTHAVKDDGAD